MPVDSEETNKTKASTFKPKSLKNQVRSNSSKAVDELVGTEGMKRFKSGLDLTHLDKLKPKSIVKQENEQ